MSKKTISKESLIIELAAKGNVKELEAIGFEGFNDINRRDSKENTPLIIAASKGHTEVVKWLLNNYSDVNLSNRKKETALMLSIRSNYVTIVNQLLQKRANPNLYDDSNLSPLLFAAKNGHLDIVKSLLEHGANVDARDSKGNNALMIAIQNNQLNIIETLLETQLNINSINENSYTALHFAMKSPAALSITKVLIDKGADISLKCRSGESPLFKACHLGNIEVVRYLVKVGASVNDVNSDGDNIIIASCNNINCLRFLLSFQNFDVNYRNNDGYTALMEAAEDGKFDSVKLLLESGTNVEFQDNYGSTALTLAKNYNYQAICKLLKENS
ncbi:ankyrin repeat domain-containing protein [Rossellomorea sp. y25]|uniref:ankyrin repeat domain-containing protein n=1 Tax=Rossellomorea sp. y25 TaxID=3118174 RepID=UPI0030E29A15